MKPGARMAKHGIVDFFTILPRVPIRQLPNPQIDIGAMEYDLSHWTDPSRYEDKIGFVAINSRLSTEIFGGHLAFGRRSFAEDTREVRPGARLAHSMNVAPCHPEAD